MTSSFSAKFAVLLPLLDGTLASNFDRYFPGTSISFWHSSPQAQADYASASLRSIVGPWSIQKLSNQLFGIVTKADSDTDIEWFVLEQQRSFVTSRFHHYCIRLFC